MEFLLLLSVASLVTVFIGTAVYFIMTLGTKEKTYEEAIMEQRQQSEAHALLLRKSATDKLKERKLKKAEKAKKVKEKAAAMKETSDSATDETEQISHSHHKNQHVAFVAEPALITDEPAPNSNQDKKKKKVSKAKPILVNKDDAQLVLDVSPSVDANHFETIHPKDDLEMRRQSRDESSDLPGKKATQKLIEAEKSSAKAKKDAPKVEKSQPPKAEKQAPVKVAKVEKAKADAKENKAPVPAPAPAPVVAKETLDKQEAAAAVEEVVVAAAAHATVAAVAATAPSKKKKKADLALQQMTVGRDGVNANFLEPLVHKAELSRSEIQNLIDILLNKQQGSATEIGEWNEGRQDPMVKLKKAFAEKEKALQIEQEASVALQNKLREVRAEANAERSRLIASNKQTEEKLLSRTNEIAAATAKFHHEKQTLTTQLQQLKHQLDQEHQVIRKFQEELGQAQNAIQTQQTLEHHVANLTVQLQAQDQQMAVLQQQVGENQAAVQQCELLSAQVAQLQEQLKNAQNSNQGEVHSKQKQLNDMKLAKEDIERQLSLTRQREGQLNSELAKLKDVVGQKQSELEKLSLEISKLREENEVLTSQVSLVSKLQLETRQLREENESLAAQVTAVTERPAAEGRENGDVAEEKHADGKLASAQLINDLRERDLQVEELLEQVKQAEKSATSTIDSLKSEINAHKGEVAHLKSELDLQRKKNDELRNKNYKAMDALAASEKMFQSKVQETEKLVHDAEKSIRVEEERKMQETMQRLFPSISVEEKVHEQWVKKFSSAVSKYVTELGNKQPSKQSPEEDQSVMIAELEKRNSQLSAMVTNYKRIIEDTEGMLNKLQQHVEAEETKWQQQLADKEAELSAAVRERDELRNGSSGDQSNVMQLQLGELQNKLQTVEDEKNKLKAQLTSSKDALATIDQLKEEQNRLSSYLASEQAKALEQANQLTKLKSLLEESENAVSKEKASSQQLREEMEKIKETYCNAPPSPVQNHNGASNGPSSSAEPVEKAVSSKKKLSGWLKKKVVGSKSPNLSAREDDFLANERLESS